MRFGGTCLVAFLFALRAAVASAEGGAARPDFSVLTPAMQGRFFVSSAVDVTAFIPPGLAIGQLATSGRTKQLRALVEREAYDPIRTIADRLIDALAVASYRAAYEPVPRGPAGSLRSLSWGDLPERPQGELILDLTVHWICLCADVTFSNHYPAISASWRLLDPARQEVVEPSRTLTYYHFPSWYHDRKEETANTRGATPATPYPAESVSETCGFASIKAAEENPAVLWGCFNEAFDAMARRLVIDLKRVHPQRADATASSGTRSGTSTR
jgi:hypothetical protein